MIILVQTNKRSFSVVFCFFPGSNSKHRSLPDSDNTGEL